MVTKSSPLLSQAGLSHEAPAVRQTLAEVLDRLLPRLLTRLDAPSATSGTFPAVVDAQVRNPEAWSQ
jgi:hypothetical protein